MNCSMPGVPVLHCLPSLLKLMSVESVMPSNHLILRCPLLLLPSIFHSIRVIFKGSVSSQKVAKVSELQLQHQSFQCVFRLMSFRIDWFELPAVQGTLKTLPQYHCSKTSILRRSLSLWSKSHPHMTGKTIALTRWTFVGNMVSLLFNTLSRFLI